MSFAPTQEVSKLDLAPPLADFRKLATKVPTVTRARAPVPSDAAASPPAEDDDDEEELDQLLNLKKPVVGNQQDTGAEEEDSAPEKGE